MLLHERELHPPRASARQIFLVLSISVLRFLFVLGGSTPSSSRCIISNVRGGILETAIRNSMEEEGRADGPGTNSTRPNTVVIDANDIIDEMARASKERAGKDGSEQVFKSTRLYDRPSPATYRSKRRKTQSRLGREGYSILRSFKTVTTRTTYGLARAVNVTGTAASVVAGGAFKLAGAAVLDAVDGIEYVSAKSPTEVPGVSDTWRFVAKGLRKTGETVYDFGVAAENVTAEATEAAEETIRTVMGSVLDAASGADLESERRGYFSDEEDRIVDNMVFGMSSADGGVTTVLAGRDTGDSAGGGGAQMGYSEEDLSAHFGRDATRGHHHHPHHRYNGAAANDERHRPSGHNHHHHHHHHLRQLTAAAAAGGSSLSSWPEQQKQRLGMLALAWRVRLAIRRSIMRSSKAVPTMRFPQMVACGMVFACRAVTRNPWCGAASFVGARIYIKFVESIYLECLKERMMSDIKFEAVARLHEGSPERARWFNTAVEAMWVPMLEPLLSGWTSKQITRGIEKSLPSNVSWVGLGKVTLGPTPPKIRYVQVQNVTSLAARKNTGTSNGVIDSVLLEAGQPGGDIVGENVVYLELGVDWTSSRSKVSLKLGEQSRRRTWWSLKSFVPTYRVKVCDLGIKAKVVVAIATGEGRPFVKRLWVGFSEPPLTHLSLEALTGMDIANLPVLRKHLRHVVMRCLMPLTEPRFLNIEVKPRPPPTTSSRGAALAARVRPAALGVRRGLLSRVPGFGLRTLLGRNSGGDNATPSSSGIADGGDGGSGSGSSTAAGGGGPAEWTGGQGKELEEATRRLLVEVGGEFREETVMAAEAAGAAGIGGDDGHGDDNNAVVPDVPQGPKGPNKAKTASHEAAKNSDYKAKATRRKGVSKKDKEAALGATMSGETGADVVGAAGRRSSSAEARKAVEPKKAPAGKATKSRNVGRNDAGKEENTARKTTTTTMTVSELEADASEEGGRRASASEARTVAPEMVTKRYKSATSKTAESSRKRNKRGRGKAETERKAEPKPDAQPLLPPLPQAKEFPVPSEEADSDGRDNSRVKGSAQGEKGKAAEMKKSKAEERPVRPGGDSSDRSGVANMTVFGFWVGDPRIKRSEDQKDTNGVGPAAEESRAGREEEVPRNATAPDDSSIDAAGETRDGGASCKVPSRPPASEARRRHARRDEMRDRRAQIKREREALREQNGGDERAAPALVRLLQGILGCGGSGDRDAGHEESSRRRRRGRRRGKKAGPEREGMIQSVCALSRPPPPLPPSKGG